VSSARAPLLETLKETQRKVLETGINSVTVLLYIRTQANFYSYLPIFLDRFMINSV